MAVSVFINDLPLKTSTLSDLDKVIIQDLNTEIVNLSSIKSYTREGYEGSTLSTIVTAVSSTSPTLSRYTMTFTNGLLTGINYI